MLKSFISDLIPYCTTNQSNFKSLIFIMFMNSLPQCSTALLATSNYAFRNEDVNFNTRGEWLERHTLARLECLLRRDHFSTIMFHNFIIFLYKTVNCGNVDRKKGHDVIIPFLLMSSIVNLNMHSELLHLTAKSTTIIFNLILKSRKHPNLRVFLLLLWFLNT